MKYLSRIEEIILLAIWKLQENAYGLKIREQVMEDTGSYWMSGAIYAPLSRLLKNRYVSSEKGEATAERGGRHKIYYKLTDDGMKNLVSIQKINDSIWKNVPELQPEDKK